MQNYKILWADDEIDLLRGHILFLEGKGFTITPVNNGTEAVERCAREHFDLVFLDEHMPGLSGLDALVQIKGARPNLPVIMITKNEEEQIMNEAIGARIDAYLIKPLNPQQILPAVKKILENRQLVVDHINTAYQQEFGRIGEAISGNPGHRKWAEIYRKLVNWELQMDSADNSAMAEVLHTQQVEANSNFWKYVDANYVKWLNDPKSDRPMLSHQLMGQKIFPHVGKGAPVFMFLIDNLRLDQWKVLEPVLSSMFVVREEDLYYSILPTATAYSRNAIFSGLLPTQMARTHPDLWVGEDEDEGKNRYEREFLQKQIERAKLDIRFSYHKIRQLHEGKELVEGFNNLWSNDLNVIVYNFVDMLSHARTDMEMIRELAADERAYRSLTRSWFEHSPLLDMLRLVATRKAHVVITTDHGMVRVNRPTKIRGERDINSNLRYKHGRNLGFEQEKDKDKLIFVRDPDRYFLPRLQVTTSYVFATEDRFFAYPTNYNHYVKMYEGTFQHGGVSLEEMIIPVVTLSPKNV